jgi:hypothetical protein
VGLTSEFGMGSGVSPLLWPLTNLFFSFSPLYFFLQKSRRYKNTKKVISMEENKLIPLKLINHKEEVEEVKNNLAKVLSEYFFISANSEGCNKIVLGFEKGDEKIKYIKEFKPMLRSEEKRKRV